MGCMYAITWNNKNYSDYSNAYFNIMEDYQKVLEGQQEGHTPYTGPWSESWTIFVPSGQESTYVSIPSSGKPETPESYFRHGTGI